MKSAAIRAAFGAAPVFLLLGVLAMKFGWKPNPDLDWSLALPLWTGAHLAYIVGNLAFAVVLAALWSWARVSARARLERGAVDVLAVAGAIGLVAMIGQMVIDLVVGFRAGQRSEMSAISRSIHEIPGFDTFFYGTVPALHLAATAVLIVLLAVRRQLPAWTAAVFTVGSLCIGTGSTALMVTGGAALCVVLPVIIRHSSYFDQQLHPHSQPRIVTPPGATTPSG